MPTFSPPTIESTLWGDPDSNDPADRLMYFHGGIETGQVVWKDQLNAWHTNEIPYWGGNRWRTFYDTELISDTSDTSVESLANAQEIYYGGRTYDITQAKANELIAAGFVVSGHITTEEQRFVDFAINSASNLEWKGGDACASLLTADGSILFTWADNLVGVTLSNGFYSSGLPTRNALLARDTNGIITQPKPNPNDFPAWVHPTPNHWWWPLDLINDGAGTSGPTVLLALHMMPGEVFGTQVGNDLLTLSVFATVADTDTLPEFRRDLFMLHSIYKDDAAGFHYIIGQEFIRESPENLLTDQTFTRLARAPIGSLTNISLWQYWSGDAWVSSLFNSTRLLDNNNNEIRGNSTLTKSGSTYVLATTDYNIEGARLFRSTTPQGPYTFYHSAHTPNPPQAGQSPPHNTQYAYYQPKFHEWLAPNSAHLALSYNRNTVVHSPALAISGPPITAFHCSTFCPQFIYLPAPT